MIRIRTIALLGCARFDSKKVTRFSVAVNKKIRRKKETKIVTDWYNVEAWGNNATPASRLRKGDPVFIQGELRTGSYIRGKVIIPTTFITVVNLRKLDYSIFGTDYAPEHDPINTEAEGRRRALLGRLALKRAALRSGLLLYAVHD